MARRSINLLGAGPSKMFEFLAPLEASRFAVALRKTGWRIMDSSNEGVLIHRPQGLPRWAFYLALATIPIGVGIVMLAFHWILKVAGPGDCRRIDIPTIETGFYAHLLR